MAPCASLSFQQPLYLTADCRFKIGRQFHGRHDGAAMRDALEAAGDKFIPENGGGPGGAAEKGCDRMTNKHPNNGPSLSNAPPKRQMPGAAPSPAREQAKLDQDARDCAKAREFNKSPIAWIRNRLLAENGSGPR